MGKLGFFHWVGDQLAKSGLILRGDPPKVIQLEGRQWGATAGGWALSIAARAETLSVILRNTEATPREIIVPGCLQSVSGAGFNLQWASARQITLNAPKPGNGEPLFFMSARL